MARSEPVLGGILETLPRNDRERFRSRLALRALLALGPLASSLRLTLLAFAAVGPLDTLRARRAFMAIAAVLPLAAVGGRLRTSGRRRLRRRGDRALRGDLALRHRRGLRAALSPVAAVFASALGTFDARRRR
jgi:hypothetical protein